MLLVRIDFAVLVLDRDGSVDSTFDDDGELFIGLNGNESARGLAVHPDGSLILAGETTAGANPSNFAIAKVGADAPTDTGFSTDGRQTLDFSTGGDGARGVVIQSDGKIVVAGFDGQARTTSPRRATT